MKLHYSQTYYNLFALFVMVLLPYEITLLSNFSWFNTVILEVLLPYEITLLSNLKFMWQRIPCSLLNRAISYAVF